MRNITDVDDDLLRKARELGVHYLDLAAAEIARFDDDMVALGMLPAYSEPRATSAIADIRGFIGQVLDAGHAYESGGAVYFDVSSYEPLRAGQPPRSRRRCWNWPPSGAATPTTRTSATRWTSCSGSRPPQTSPRGSHVGARDDPAGTSSARALALRELGDTIDLHGGGADLVFPHHECEAAQSESATGKPFVRHWLHQAMVRLDGEKMSKSLGNLVFVSELRTRVDPMEIRLALLDHHYRTPWEWSDGDLATAARPARTVARCSWRFGVGDRRGPCCVGR